MRRTGGMLSFVGERVRVCAAVEKASPAKKGRWWKERQGEEQFQRVRNRDKRKRQKDKDILYSSTSLGRERDRERGGREGAVPSGGVIGGLYVCVKG